MTRRCPVYTVASINDNDDDLELTFRPDADLFILSNGLTLSIHLTPNKLDRLITTLTAGQRERDDRQEIVTSWGTAEIPVPKPRT